ncbi:rhomboid-like protein [Mycolicibacterium goodii]|uniref:rhomboid-like protein n=1 Tax=Mycolicibacterium goodii TaxID=134601 RepID=UPI00256F5D16|nr:rhomboid-like protein [Mycolicibacterium goodii]
MPVSAATADDVGLSYGAVAVLGALTSSLPVLWRTGWAAGWLTIAVVVAAAGVDFTAIGHAVALVLGMLLSVRYRSDDRWTRSRKSLLAVGIAFGALLLVGASPSVAPFALGGGMLVAASITAVRRRLHRRPRSVDEGAMGAALA